MPTSESSASAGPAEAEAWLTPHRFGLLLALLLIASFPAVVTGTKSFFFRDFGTVAYPTVCYQRTAFWRGELPLWNPLSHCGVPFLAQWNTLVLYPGALIYLLLPLPWSLNLFCLAHLWLAGFGMFRLARRWTANHLAAGVAGVAFAFSGIVLASHIYPNYLVALGWMPWVVLTAEAACRLGGRHVVLAALVGAMQMLSGAPELILETWLVVAGLLVVELALRRTQPWRPLGRLLAVAGFVAGLCAAQLLPFLALLTRAQRGTGYADAFWSLPAWGWADLIVPLFRCFRTPQGVWFESGQVFLGSVYPGIAVVALALLALGRRQGRRFWLLTVLAAAGLLLALGEHSLLYRVARSIAPFLSVMRYPIKFIFLVAFALPLLAAFGVNSLADKPRSRAVRFSMIAGLPILAAIGAIVAFAAAHPLPTDDRLALCRNAAARAGFLIVILAALVARAFESSPRLARFLGAAVLLLLWLDARMAMPLVTPAIASAALAPGMAELRPPPRPGEARAFIAPQAERLLATRLLPDFTQDFLGARLALWANLNLVEGLPKVNGAMTLRLSEEAEVEARLYTSPTNRFPRLEAFLGAAFASAPNNPVEWVPRAHQLPVVTAGQRPVFASGTDALAALFAPDFRPADVVYLPPAARGGVRAGPATAQVTNVEFTAERIAAVVASPSATMLVLAQTFDPNWRARVDGQPVRLWRADFAFQAVALSAGRHQVELVYRDSAFEIGTALSLLTLVGGGWFWRRELPRPRSPGRAICR